MSGQFQRRPARIYATATRDLQKTILRDYPRKEPPWYKILNHVPPSGYPARAVPNIHQVGDYKGREETPEWYTNLLEDPNSLPPLEVEDPRRFEFRGALAKKKKPRQPLVPTNIKFQEDGLRTHFFKQHPWELARPRILVETDGKDAQRYDWSKGLRQPGLPLCGEWYVCVKEAESKVNRCSVVKRQMYLMNETGLQRKVAYDQARKEFYRLRHREELEERIAKEEATFVGAYFVGNKIDRALPIEDRQFNDWKQWADKESHRRANQEVSRSGIFGKDEDLVEPDVEEAEEPKMPPKPVNVSL